MKTENNGHLDRQKEGEYKNESKDKLIEKYFG